MSVYYWFLSVFISILHTTNLANTLKQRHLLHVCRPTPVKPNLTQTRPTLNCPAVENIHIRVLPRVEWWCSYLISGCSTHIQCRFGLVWLSRHFSRRLPEVTLRMPTSSTRFPSAVTLHYWTYAGWLSLIEKTTLRQETDVLILLYIILMSWG